MSRVQKKCFLASAGFHLLLLALLVVGSAFVTPPSKQESVTLLNMIPRHLIDEALQGGGSPTANQAPVPAPSVSEPAPLPVEPEPKPVRPPEPEPDPEPVAKPVETPVQKPIEKPVEPKPIKPVEKPVEKPAEKVVKKPVKPLKNVLPPKETTAPKTKDPDALVRQKPEPKVKETASAKKTPEPKPTEAKPVEPKRQIVVDLKSVKKPDNSAAEAEAKARKEREVREAREARERAVAYAAAVADANAKARAAADARQQAFRSSLGAIQGNLSTGTTVEMPGPGGEAYANYGLAIRSIYYEAWRSPDEADRAATVRVEVTVARDGRVISSRLLSRTGDSALDKSVQKAVDRVKQLPPFPSGAADETRTFRINFNLKAKRTIG